MYLFYSPPVQAYTCLASHYNACETVQKLLSTSNIEFQLVSSDNANDPYNLIYSRTRSIRHRLEKTIELIECKYNEQIHTLSKAQKQITLSQMRTYIHENQLDHLKYMDGEEAWIEEKLTNITHMMNNYDSFFSMKKKIQNQLDCLKTKIQVCKDGHFLQQFVVISGICHNKNIQILERLIFRKTRGHSVTFFRSRERDPHTSIFLCFMNKTIYSYIGQKIIKACQCNDVLFYELPNQMKNMEAHGKKLFQDLNQSQEMVQVSGKQLTRVLSQSIIHEGDSLMSHLLRISYLERLIYIICHSKKIGTHTVLTFYAPQNFPLPNLGCSILTIASKKPRTIMPTIQCLSQVNILTELFSIPKHNELIPSIFMFLTVPVLFGMMFSDFGHGILLVTLCYIFGLKPIFYLMGFMSIYCGIIYNQFFGMKILQIQNLGVVQPIWAVAENGLNFQNSLKMKISMIIAFVHMGFGMCIKVINQKRRGKFKTIIYDSLPKIGLLFTTVGYLVYLIIAKWLTNYDNQESTAPSIINSVLQLYLGWNQNRKHSILGTMQNQKYVGSILLKFDMLFIGIMIFNQTIRSRVESMWQNVSKSSKSRKKLGNKSPSKGYNQLDDRHQLEQDESQEVYRISEQLEKRRTRSLESLNEEETIIQVEEEQSSHASELGPLEIFQFLLSLISATTSYLRLFALSLAHAKLSSLILDMLLATLANQHPYVSYARCLVFTAVTLSMMLALDVMQCMMHVVRLHWVQWMGRFYQGGGCLFKPDKEGEYY